MATTFLSRRLIALFVGTALSLASLPTFVLAQAPLKEEFDFKREKQQFNSKVDDSSIVAQACNETVLQSHVKNLTGESLFPLEILINCQTASVPLLIEALQDERWETRVLAAYSLGEIGTNTENAIQGLITATTDDALDVRYSAIGALGKIGSEKAIPNLAKALQDENNEVQISAINAIIRIGSKAYNYAFTDLMNTLQSDNQMYRYYMRSFDFFIEKSEIEDNENIAFLYKLLFSLGSSDWLVRQTAIRAYVDAIKSDSSLISTLASIMSIGRGEGLTKSQLAYTTAQLNPDTVVEILQSDHFYGYGDLGMELAVSLQTLQNSNNEIPYLLQLLEQEDENIQITAANALGILNSKETVQSLIQTLEKSESTDVKISVIEALGSIGSVNAVPILINYFLTNYSEANTWVGREAAISLGKIGSESAVSTLVTALDKPATQRNALIAFSSLNPNEVTDVFNQGRYQARTIFLDIINSELNDKYADFDSIYGPSLSRDAIGSLSYLGEKILPDIILGNIIQPEQGLPLFADLFNGFPKKEYRYLNYASVLEADSDCDAGYFFGYERQDILTFTSDYIKHVGSDFLPDILALLKAEELDSYTFNIIATLIDAIGSEAAVPDLVEIARDLNKDTSSRRYAIAALGSLGSQEAIAGLIQILSDADVGVRNEATRALGHAGSGVAIPSLVKVSNEASQLRESLPAESEEKRQYMQLEFDSALALAMLGSPEKISFLKQVIESQNHIAIGDIWVSQDSYIDEDRKDAAIVLRYLDDPAIPILVETLRDKNWKVSYFAAESLAFIGDEAIPELEAIIMAYSNLPPALKVALQEKNLNQRRNTAYVLSQMESSNTALSLLKEIAEDRTEHDAVRWVAAVALEERGIAVNYGFPQQYETAQMLMDVCNPHYAKESFFIGGCIYYDIPPCGDGLHSIYQSLRDLIARSREK